ncbi:hypothetical protein [Chryseobacterium sp. GVT01B]|uniref:hypothetical protein n=1 Tax=Chryseobacterium sp. GVT01B TaxID=2862675 RepID=UPI001CBB30FD|nr:hypothetical protein [Chryseobacterium sp. GVT01B]
MYDKNHKIIKVSTDEIIKKNPKISRASSGVYEGNLLCSDCESKIISGNYETYLADIISGKNKNIKCTQEISGEVQTIKIDNLDYKRFKNFFLSILFRADICSFEEFNDVNLGPYHEKIRKIVYENLTTTDLEFQLNIFKLDKKSEFNQLIVQPFKSKLETETCYSFLLKDYLIIINFKENKTSKLMKENRLKQSGQIVIPIIPKSTEKKFILTYMDLI